MGKKTTRVDNCYDVLVRAVRSGKKKDAVVYVVNNGIQSGGDPDNNKKNSNNNNSNNSKIKNDISMFSQRNTVGTNTRVGGERGLRGNEV